MIREGPSVDFDASGFTAGYFFDVARVSPLQTMIFSEEQDPIVRLSRERSLIGMTLLQLGDVRQHVFDEFTKLVDVGVDTVLWDPGEYYFPHIQNDARGGARYSKVDVFNGIKATFEMPFYTTGAEQWEFAAGVIDGKAFGVYVLSQTDRTQSNFTKDLVYCAFNHINDMKNLETVNLTSYRPKLKIAGRKPDELQGMILSDFPLINSRGEIILNAQLVNGFSQKSHEMIHGALSPFLDRAAAMPNRA